MTFKSIIFTLLFSSSILMAYETSLPNLMTPSTLDKGMLVYDIQHRFYGDITKDVLDTFFGTKGGANVGMMIRYSPMANLETTLRYLSRSNGYSLGASSGLPSVVPHITSQLGVCFLSENPTGKNRQSDTQAHINIQGPSLFNDRIIPVGTFGYAKEETYFAAGVEAHILGSLYFTHEFYPKKDNLDTKLVFGLRYETFGHHFHLTAQNSTEVTPGGIASSKPLEYYALGFNIQRLIAF